MEDLIHDHIPERRFSSPVHGFNNPVRSISPSERRNVLVAEEPVEDLMQRFRNLSTNVNPCGIIKVIEVRFNDHNHIFSFALDTGGNTSVRCCLEIARRTTDHLQEFTNNFIAMDAEEIYAKWLFDDIEKGRTELCCAYGGKPYLCHGLFETCNCTGSWTPMGSHCYRRRYNSDPAEFKYNCYDRVFTVRSRDNNIFYLLFHVEWFDEASGKVPIVEILCNSPSKQIKCETEILKDYERQNMLYFERKRAAWSCSTRMDLQ